MRQVFASLQKESRSLEKKRGNRGSYALVGRDVLQEDIHVLLDVELHEDVQQILSWIKQSIATPVVYCRTVFVLLMNGW